MRTYPQPVWVDIPNRYIEPLRLPALPDAAIDGGILLDDISTCEDVVDRCNADRLKLLEINQQRGRARE